MYRIGRYIDICLLNQHFKAYSSYTTCQVYSFLFFDIFNIIFRLFTHICSHLHFSHGLKNSDAFMPTDAVRHG